MISTNNSQFSFWSNASGNVFGPWRATRQLKMPSKGLRWESCFEEWKRKAYEDSLTFLDNCKRIFFCVKANRKNSVGGQTRPFPPDLLECFSDGRQQLEIKSTLPFLGLTWCQRTFVFLLSNPPPTHIFQKWWIKDVSFYLLFRINRKTQQCQQKSGFFLSSPNWFY